MVREILGNSLQKLSNLEGVGLSKRRRFESSAVGILALVFGLSSGCVKRSQKLEYGLEINETLRVNVSTEPPSLDWSKSTDTTSNTILVNIMDGLAGYDLDDPKMSVVPALAASWESSKDAKTWTIRLKQGVKWTDGVEFEAQHILDSWERLLNPKTAAEYSYFLYPVKNAREYNQGKLKDFSQVAVKAPDKYTLVVELTEAKSFFPYLLTHHSTYPIRKSVVEKFGDKWTQPGNIVTLGAYKLKTWDHDKALVLERNDEYYGEKAKTKNVLAYIIPEQSTAIGLIEAGKLDAQPELPSAELAKLKNKKEFKTIGTLVLQYYGFNVKKPPFDDVRVRRAFAMAVDRQEIVKILNGGQVPLTSWIPVGMSGHEGERGLRFDPAKAKALLKEAGYGEGAKPFPRVTIAFNTNENHKRIAENVQAQLKRNLAVDIELRNEEWKVYLNTLKTDAPQIFRMGWNGDYPDPDNFMNLMTSYSENNRTGWGNKAYDSLIEKGARELDLGKRLEAYSQAQKILVEEEVPALPLYSAKGQYLVSDRIKGYPINILAHYNFRRVEITQ